MEFFTQDTVVFLEQIKANNSKEWFALHKGEYEEFIKKPSSAFAQEMGEHLMALEPSIKFAPKINHSLFKIYRDSRRMGANKQPIKEKIGLIWWQGSGKRLQSSSFYMHFDTKEIFISSGVRWFEKPLLDAYRETIKAEQKREELYSILELMKKSGFGVVPPAFKRYPRGFTKEMPFVELSLYKAMAVYTTLDIRHLFGGEEFIDTLFGIYEKMHPLQQFVYEMSLKVKDG